MQGPSSLRWPARPLYAALVVALVLLAAWGLWPRALDVEVATVASAPLETGFTEEGRTRLRDRFVVSAPVDGVVERIALEPGDAVAAGATVAVLRPAAAALLDPLARSDAQARWRTAGDELEAADAGIAAAQAARDRAIAALRRIEALATKQQVALDQRDEARSQAAAAEAALRSAKATRAAAGSRLDAARAWLDLQGSTHRDGARLALSAPVSGLVMRRHVESEGPVRAGQPLLELGDPKSLEVVVEVLTADALQLAPGMKVRLDPGHGQAPIAGRVQAIEPSGFTKVSALGVEEQRVLVVVALPADAPALGDAYRVDARFETWTAPSVLAVPVPALFRDGGHWAVYVADGGRARLRRVDVGHVGDTAAEVLHGLAAGERVVVYPGDQVRDGRRIAWTDAPAP
jgi:HlyD family secretion protein